MYLLFGGINNIDGTQLVRVFTNIAQIRQFVKTNDIWPYDVVVMAINNAAVVHPSDYTPIDWD